jgi:hypothetical protein
VFAIPLTLLTTGKKKLGLDPAGIMGAFYSSAVLLLGRLKAGMKLVQSSCCLLVCCAPMPVCCFCFELTFYISL